MHYIITTDSLTVVRDGRPVTLNRPEIGDEMFNDAVQAVHDNNLEAIYKIADRGTEVTRYFAGQDIEVRNGVLFYGDEELDNYPAKKAVEFWKLGLPHEALIQFIRKLLGNPSYRAVQDLYSFIEFNRMPLTDDGCFLAYKKIYRQADGSFVDVFTRKIPNDVGCVVEMPRHKVDEDPYRTCSHGLHVCGFDYLPSFGAGAWDCVVICKIDPANVVAVPVDYNNAKMRVCKYEVVGQIEDYEDYSHRWEDEVIDSRFATSTLDLFAQEHHEEDDFTETDEETCVRCTHDLDEDGDCDNEDCPEAYNFRG